MILEEAKSHAEAADWDAAIELLNGHPNAAEAMDAYGDLVLHLYWKRKDLPAVIALARAGVARMLEEAQRQAGRNEKKAAAAKMAAMATTYNLASFCWPGWNEAGIVIGPEEVKIGRDAALQHYAIVKSLNLDDLKMARALWIVAVLHLSMQEIDTARTKFRESAELAGRAGNEGERLLARGFEVLCDLVDGADVDDTPQAKLDEIKRQLASVEHGEDYISQIETAAAVNKRTRSAAQR